VYPGGFYDSESLRIVRESGHKYAFNTHLGLSDLSHSSLELNRINMLPGTTPEKLEDTIQQLETMQQ
jgi:hypothetical protein